MPYITNTDLDRQEMLKTIGVADFKELLVDIPADCLLNRDLNLDKGLSEMEIGSLAGRLAKKNINANDVVSFLGGGAYDHYIPSIIGAVTSRSEFYTAYTPYQAEVSQGTLQTIYEFQSLVCNLFGMDVSNASMYDGATAMAEAAVMACHHTNKKKVLMASTIHPTFLQVVKTFLDSFHFEVVIVNEEHGVVPFAAYEKSFADDVAAIIVQNPNFYGNIEELQGLGDLAHSKKALFIVGVDPISLGLLKKPSEYGADIVVAEGQSLGLPQSFGGPYLGMLAAKKELMRKMPGRIVGITEDAEGKRGFALTLQTREQHIRREKATSNICSNEALMALSASIYLNYMGEEGFKQVAKNCYLGSHYLAGEIAKVDGLELRYKAPFFKEFVVKSSKPVEKIVDKMLDKGFFAGIPITHFGKCENCLLVAVTEKRSKEEIDLFVKTLKEVVASI